MRHWSNSRVIRYIDQPSMTRAHSSRANLNIGGVTIPLLLSISSAPGRRLEIGSMKGVSELRFLQSAAVPRATEQQEGT
jgi:hypothetical protein